MAQTKTGSNVTFIVRGRRARRPDAKKTTSSKSNSDEGELAEQPQRPKT